mmetsp:Transcript_67919/g.183439  ORF Transcript_67919/g.183439 Transcript_67919/m.183439 type:complete len:225 (+) Transcript_67919:408-1082(+)
MSRLAPSPLAESHVCSAGPAGALARSAPPAPAAGAAGFTSGSGAAAGAAVPHSGAVASGKNSFTPPANPLEDNECGLVRVLASLRRALASPNAIGTAYGGTGATLALASAPAAPLNVGGGAALVLASPRGQVRAGPAGELIGVPGVHQPGPATHGGAVARAAVVGLVLISPQLSDACSASASAGNDAPCEGGCWRAFAGPSPPRPRSPNVTTPLGVRAAGDWPP